MKSKRKIALFATGDKHWTGGTQYTLNIINALNTIVDLDIELFLFTAEHHEFNDLNLFKNIKINQRHLNEVLPKWTFINKVIWFIQRKLFKRIYPRLENYLLKNKLSFANNSVNTNLYYVNYYYPDSLVFFDRAPNPIIVGVANEVGITFSNLPDFLFFDAPEVGIGIRYSGDIQVYRIVFGAPF